eukprot:gene4440-4691_t
MPLALKRFNSLDLMPPHHSLDLSPSWAASRLYKTAGAEAFALPLTQADAGAARQGMDQLAPTDAAPGRCAPGFSPQKSFRRALSQNVFSPGAQQPLAALPALSVDAHGSGTSRTKRPRPSPSPLDPAAISQPPPLRQTTIDSFVYNNHLSPDDFSPPGPALRIRKPELHTVGWNMPRTHAVAFETPMMIKMTEEQEDLQKTAASFTIVEGVTKHDILAQVAGVAPYLIAEIFNQQGPGQQSGILQLLAEMKRTAKDRVLNTPELMHMPVQPHPHMPMAVGPAGCTNDNTLAQREKVLSKLETRSAK